MSDTGVEERHGTEETGLVRHEDGETSEEVGEGKMREVREVAETMAVHDGDVVDRVGGGMGEDIGRRETRVMGAHEGLGEGGAREGVNGGVEGFCDVTSDGILRSKSVDRSTHER